MQVKATEIHVDGTHNGNVMIGYNHFFMQETGGIFINPYTGFNELAIIGTGHGKNGFLIRNTGGDNTHINA